MLEAIDCGIPGASHQINRRLLRTFAAQRILEMAVEGRWVWLLTVRDPPLRNLVAWKIGVEVFRRQARGWQFARFRHTDSVTKKDD